MKEPFSGGPANSGGCDDDEPSFNAAGKVFRLGVPIGVILVGGPRGDSKGGDGKKRGSKIGQRFQSIREHADRAGEMPRRQFEEKSNHCGSHREPRIAGQGNGAR